MVTLIEGMYIVAWLWLFSSSYHNLIIFFWIFYRAWHGIFLHYSSILSTKVCVMQIMILSKEKCCNIKMILIWIPRKSLGKKNLNTKHWTSSGFSIHTSHVVVVVTPLCCTYFSFKTVRCVISRIITKSDSK